MGIFTSITARRSRRIIETRLRNARKIGRVETLEDRILLTVNHTFTDGHLVIDDYNSNIDEIIVAISDSRELTVNGNTLAQVTPATVSSIRIYGGMGDDVIDVSIIEPNTFPLLQNRAIAVFGGGGNDTISGSQFGDHLYGGSGDDLIFGFLGDDAINGNGGIDELHGGFGDDLLQAMNPSHAGIPNVMKAETTTDYATGNQSINVSFDQDTFVTQNALAVLDSTGEEVDVSAATFTVDPVHLSASWDLSQVGLLPDSYTYSIRHDAVQGIDGLFLDGNSDGIGGDDFRGKMNIGALSTQLEILSFNVNDANSDHSQLNSVSVTFSKDVTNSLDATDLVLQSADGTQEIQAMSVAFDGQANMATWTFDAAQIPAGYYVAEINGFGVTDEFGGELHGDFVAAGTDYRRTILVANPGDLNLDGAVKPAEAIAIVGSIGAVSASWTDGDLTGNGIVEPLDALIAIGNVGSVVTDVQPVPISTVGSLVEALHGDSGNDHFVFHTPKGNVVNHVFDTDGQDTVYFNRVSHQGVEVDLRQETQLLRGPKPADVLNLSLESGVIENVVGSPFDDTLVGDNFANKLFGGAGNDELSGLGGDDDLFGGTGDDLYRFTGNESLGHDFILEAPMAGDDSIDFVGLAGLLQYSSRVRSQSVGSFLELTTDNYNGEVADIERILPSTTVLTSTGPVTGLRHGVFSAAVASFSDSLAGGLPSEYEAIIDWGDGETVTGEITNEGSEFLVRGRHEYVGQPTTTPEVRLRGRDGNWLTQPIDIDVLNSFIFDADGQLENDILAEVDFELPYRGALTAVAQSHRSSQNEVLAINRSARVLSGTFRLASEGQTTDWLSWDSSAAVVKQAIISGFSEFESNDLIVSATTTGWEVEFAGTWATQSPPEIAVEHSVQASPLLVVNHYEEVSVRLSHALTAGQQLSPDGFFNVDLGGETILSGPMTAFSDQASLEAIIDAQIGSDFGSQITVTPEVTGLGASLTVAIRREVTGSATEIVQTPFVHIQDPRCNSVQDTTCVRWTTVREVSRETHVTTRPEPSAGSFEAVLEWLDEEEDDTNVGVHPFNHVGALNVAISDKLDDELFGILTTIDDAPWQYGWGTYWDDLPDNQSSRDKLVFYSTAQVTTYTATGELIGVDQFSPPLETHDPFLPLNSTFFAWVSDVDLTTGGSVDAEIVQTAHTPRNEVQTIFVPPWLSSDTFILQYDNQEIVVPVDATSPELQAHLEGVIGMGNVSVTDIPPGTNINAWRVEFVGSLAATDVQLLRRPIWIDLDAIIDWDPNSSDPIFDTVGGLTPGGPFVAGRSYSARVTGTNPQGPLAPGRHDIDISLVDAAFESFLDWRTSIFVGDVQTSTLSAVVTPGVATTISLASLDLAADSNVLLQPSQKIETWKFDWDQQVLTLTPDQPLDEHDAITLVIMGNGDISEVAHVKFELDTDGDGLTDEYEVLTSLTDPQKRSTDSDRMDDAFELLYGLDPFNSDENGNGIRDDFDDFDGDGLVGFDEWASFTDPRAQDSDGDGVSDGVETEQGSNPSDGSDGGLPPVANPDDRKLRISTAADASQDVGKFTLTSPVGGIQSWSTFERQATAEVHEFIVQPSRKYELRYDPIGAFIPDDGSVSLSGNIDAEQQLVFRGPPLSSFHNAPKTWTVYVPEVDLAIFKPDGMEIPDDEELQVKAVVATNGDDDNENGILDANDSIVRGEDDLLKLRVSRITPIELKGDFVFKFLDDLAFWERKRIRLWKSPNKTGEIISGETKLDASKEWNVYVEGIGGVLGPHDIQIEVEFQASESELTTRGTVASDKVRVVVADDGLTAYRPQATYDGQGTEYKYPDWHSDTVVPDDKEFDDKFGAGIRFNGDDDNNNGLADRLENAPTENVQFENDLIRIDVKKPQFNLPVRLRLPSDDLELWTGKNKESKVSVNSELLTEPIQFGNESTKTLWIENTGAAFESGDVKLETDENFIIDSLRLHRFKNFTFLIHGENTPIEDTDAGMHLLMRDLYRSGYDVFVYDEPDLLNASIDMDEAREVARRAVEDHAVDTITMMGYSHGGGFLYDVSNELSSQNWTNAWSLVLTGYVDAVAQPAANPLAENRRPIGSAKHVNYFQVANEPSSLTLDGTASQPELPQDINEDVDYLNVSHTTVHVHPYVIQRLSSAAKQVSR